MLGPQEVVLWEVGGRGDCSLLGVMLKKEIRFKDLSPPSFLSCLVIGGKTRGKSWEKEQPTK